MSKLTKSALLLLILAHAQQALSWDLVELGNVTVEHKNFYSGTTPYLPDHRALTETNFKFDVVMFGSGFIRNTIHSQTDKTQYRLVGWNWELGFKPFDWLELGWWHFSKHQLDAQDPSFGSGWNEDGIIMRIHLRKGPQPNGIF